ncbi:MAG TPA: hypothetical protein VGZ73_18645 [Bryobacteraceae bacterium]|jgi:hypothetical protein|nr:hypothetical protein [Bryobacteraceae bacterium]
MGQELECRLHYQRRTLAGKAYLETDYVLFRGEERLKILLKDLTVVKASGGVLTLEFAGGEAELELGKAAEKWREKILHPPSRLEKLGVKPGLSVRLAGEFEAGFLDELRVENAALAQGRSKVDLVFFAAERASVLHQVATLAAGMKPDGAIWVVYPKGVAAIREMDVLNAGRDGGLKDVKVARFSTTHTALKFVAPLEKR